MCVCVRPILLLALCRLAVVLLGCTEAAQAMNHPFLCSLKTEGKRENQTQTEEVELIVVASSFVVGMLAAGERLAAKFS